MNGRVHIDTENIDWSYSKTQSIWNGHVQIHRHDLMLIFKDIEKGEWLSS